MRRRGRNRLPTLDPAANVSSTPARGVAEGAINNPMLLHTILKTVGYVVLAGMIGAIVYSAYISLTYYSGIGV